MSKAKGDGLKRLIKSTARVNRNLELKIDRDSIRMLLREPKHVYSLLHVYLQKVIDFNRPDLSEVHVQFVKEIKPFIIVNKNFDGVNCIRRKIGQEGDDRKCLKIDFSEDVVKKIVEKNYVVFNLSCYSFEV